MKKKILIFSLLGIATIGLNSCRDTEEKTIIKEVDREETPEVEVIEEEDKGILERTGEEIDQEINEEIDKIGNDSL